MQHFIEDLGVSVIGGCCGTTDKHIARLADLATRVTPKQRAFEWTPSASSIYASMPMHVDPAPVLVGERCNTNGSKKFREILLQEDWDSAVSMAKEQIREGAHMIDLCVAYVGRDEVRDMREVITRMNTAVTVPIVIDSTEVPVIEVALKSYAGRAIVNSINLENGRERIDTVMPLVMRHGAEPWEDLAVKLMLKWPNLYYSTSAFAPRHYPKAIIDYANTRGADRIIYAGYFPMGLTLSRIFNDMPHVPFNDNVWPKFLRENAIRVFKLDEDR